MFCILFVFTLYTDLHSTSVYQEISKLVCNLAYAGSQCLFKLKNSSSQLLHKKEKQVEVHISDSDKADAVVYIIGERKEYCRPVGR